MVVVNPDPSLTVRTWGDMLRWLGRQFWPTTVWDVAWPVAEVGIAVALLALDVPVWRILLALLAALIVQCLGARLMSGCTDCDRCGRCARDDGIPDRLRRSARVAALRDGGWLIRRGEDLCRACGGRALAAKARLDAAIVDAQARYDAATDTFAPRGEVR